MNFLDDIGLEKIIYFTLFILSTILLVFGIHILVNKKTEQKLQKVVQNFLIESYNLDISESECRPYKEIPRLQHCSWEYDSSVYVLHRISGKSGPYMGVFEYNTNKSINFIGLIGVSNKDVWLYGISERTISVVSNKLEYLFLSRKKLL